MERNDYTIVLPVYNVAKFLERCLNSIINQKYTNIQIIMLDDGSSDTSSELCDMWALKDERICVIHKLNSGVGMTRNIGIKMARGKYICFFDSDDYISENTILKVNMSMQKYEADVVVFGMTLLDRFGKPKKKRIPNIPKSFFYESEIQNYVLPNMISFDPNTGVNVNIPMSACTCVYSMKLINDVGWHFESEHHIISEDFYAQLLLYYYVKKVCVIDEGLYYYCENDVSLTHSYREDRFEKIKHWYTVSLDLCNSLGYSEDIKKRLNIQFFSNIIGAQKLIMKSDLSRCKKRQLIKEMIEDPVLQQILKKTDFSKDTFFRRLFLKEMKHKMAFFVYQSLYLKVRLER